MRCQRPNFRRAAPFQKRQPHTKALSHEKRRLSIEKPMVGAARRADPNQRQSRPCPRMTRIPANKNQAGKSFLYCIPIRATARLRLRCRRRQPRHWAVARKHIEDGPKGAASGREQGKASPSKHSRSFAGRISAFRFSSASRRLCGRA